jgi:hypothetical protein
MRHPFKNSALLLMAALAAGCATTTTGTGHGSTASGANPIPITWKSTDRVSGEMQATTADGTTYRGSYFQITNEASVQGIGSGWVPGPLGAGLWDGTGSATNYTGRVLANLTSPAGAHMQCAFILAQPSAGFAGGGGGLCLPPLGNPLQVEIPRT